MARPIHGWPPKAPRANSPAGTRDPQGFPPAGGGSLSGLPSLLDGDSFSPQTGQRLGELTVTGNGHCQGLNWAVQLYTPEHAAGPLAVGVILVSSTSEPHPPAGLLGP